MSNFAIEADEYQDVSFRFGANTLGVIQDCTSSGSCCDIARIG